MRRAAPALALALAASAFVAPAPAEEGGISSVAPHMASGDVALEIRGRGFGSARPDVVLLRRTGGRGRRVARMRVTTWSDARIVGELRGLVPGRWDVVVQPGGRRDARIVRRVALMVEGPRVLPGGRRGVRAGEVVEWGGAFLGEERGTVHVGGRRADVVAWSDTGLAFVVPQRLPDRAVDVVVTNRTARRTVDSALVVRPEPPPEREVARLVAEGTDGTRFRVASRGAATVVADPSRDVAWVYTALAGGGTSVHRLDPPYEEAHDDGSWPQYVFGDSVATDGLSVAVAARGTGPDASVLLFFRQRAEDAPSVLIRMRRAFAVGTDGPDDFPVDVAMDAQSVAAIQASVARPDDGVVVVTTPRGVPAAIPGEPAEWIGGRPTSLAFENGALDVTIRGVVRRWRLVDDAWTEQPR